MTLKLPETMVAPDDPWHDDVLGRAQLGERLTNLVRFQSSPFAISLYGYWGTGKTFLLQRWQAQLERDSFRAIYFNAWEDDFCEDPLLAILGQLSDSFEKDGLGAIIQNVTDIALPLLRQNFHSILHRHTGVTLQLDSQNRDEDLLQVYRDQRATKVQLRSRLAEMSATVKEETGHPLVFIIDELDRCRPTFAIELLERVKHIFDAPNMVFVFGLNRDELCRSLSSLYGDINTDIYLRRFFDMEFTLPEANSELFAGTLIQRYELAEGFDVPSGNTRHPTGSELKAVTDNFPRLWRYLGLSLRDIDYCVRSISFVGRNLESGRTMVPFLLGAIITIKLINNSLYRRFMKQSCHAAEIIDYLDKETLSPVPDRDLQFTLDIVEAYLYAAEWSDDFQVSAENALGQLKLLRDQEHLTHPEYLSKRIQNRGRDSVERVIQIMSDPMSGARRNTSDYIGSLIDIHQGMVRR